MHPTFIHAGCTAVASLGYGKAANGSARCGHASVGFDGVVPRYRAIHPKHRNQLASSAHRLPSHAAGRYKDEEHWLLSGACLDSTLG